MDSVYTPVFSECIGKVTDSPRRCITHSPRVSKQRSLAGMCRTLSHEEAKVTSREYIGSVPQVSQWRGIYRTFRWANKGHSWGGDIAHPPPNKLYGTGQGNSRHAKNTKRSHYSIPYSHQFLWHINRCAGCWSGIWIFVISERPP